MKSERKKLYIAAAINFLIGIIVGIILFYGQIRSNADLNTTEYTYDKTVSLTDFFRVSWLNMLWAFSAFIMHNILPSAYVYPIISVRGCASSFCAMYMLRFIGIKEGIVSVLPQCFSILPFLILLCTKFVEKRRIAGTTSGHMLSLRRSETVMIFFLSTIAAALETVFFRFFCFCLF